MITFFIPDSKITMQFRGWLYSLFMPKCGKNFQVSSGAKLFGINKLYVGNNVFIATNTVINTGGNIILQDDVMIGIGSVIVAGNHTLEGSSYRFGQREEKDIIIGQGSWIAANCTVISGSQFPPSSVLAANSVFLFHDEVKSGIYAGVPAKLLKIYKAPHNGVKNDWCRHCLRR
nr:acyltransferase [Providencia sp. wls1943]